MDFRRKADVQYNDFTGTIAVDRSSAWIDDIAICNFVKNHPQDNKGKNIDYDNLYFRAFRAYYHEDHPNKISVNIRMEDNKHKMHDFSIDNVSLADFFFQKNIYNTPLPRHTFTDISFVLFVFYHKC